jgi:CRP-like cAMP-binding protein
MEHTSATDKTKIFRKGQIIFREGQESAEAYIVKQGLVTLYRVVHNKRVVIAEVGPGQTFGEMGALGMGKRATNAEASEYTEVLVLDDKLLRTMLLKSPRPVQLIAHYLMERVHQMSAQVTDQPAADPFQAVCRILALCQQAADQIKGEDAEMDYADVSRSIRDILLISQVEIDAVVEKLARLKIIAVREVKGAYYRQDPISGGKVKSSDFVKQRFVRVPDVESFLTVARNVRQDMQRGEQSGTRDLEFVDLEHFAAEVDSSPEIIHRKIAYGEIPARFIFLHKTSAMALAQEMGPDFFKQAKRPRLKTEDLQRADDLVFVDNATLQEVFSQLGFRKVAVLTAMTVEETRRKILANLSKNIASIVRDEIKTIGEPDPDEAADVEDELLARIKTIKGLSA